MTKKLHLKNPKTPVLTINRGAFGKDCLAYIAVSNRAFKYPHGKSKIVYIGTTKNGADRIASSAAKKASEILKNHGVTSLAFHIVTCAGRQGLSRPWVKLERALLIRFREEYGEVPVANRHGRRMIWKDEKDYFSVDRLLTVLEQHSGKTNA